MALLSMREVWTMVNGNMGEYVNYAKGRRFRVNLEPSESLNDRAREYMQSIAGREGVIVDAWVAMAGLGGQFIGYKVQLDGEGETRNLQWGDVEIIDEEDFDMNPKEMLRNMCVVELRDGEEYVYVNNVNAFIHSEPRDMIISLSDGYYLDLSEYNQDLEHRDGGTYDIVKIIYPGYTGHVISKCLASANQPFLEYYSGTVVWESKNKKRKMTIEDIESALGYKVEIIDKHNEGGE